MSLRSTILDTLVTRLNTSRPGGIPQAERELLDDLPKGTDLAISVGEFSEKIEKKGGARGPIVMRSTVFAVDAWARATTGVSAGKNLDPLLDWITKQVGGWTVAGVIDQSDEAEIQWDRERKQSGAAHATVFVVAKYLTKVDDATVPS